MASPWDVTNCFRLQFLRMWFIVILLKSPKIAKPMSGYLVCRWSMDSNRCCLRRSWWGEISWNVNTTDSDDRMYLWAVSLVVLESTHTLQIIRNKDLWNIRCSYLWYYIHRNSATSISDISNITTRFWKQIIAVNWTCIVWYVWAEPRFCNHCHINRLLVV